MTANSNWLRRTFVLAAFFTSGLGCEAGGDTTVIPGDEGTTSSDDQTTGTATLALRFETLGDTETRCGSVEGIHVMIRDANGAAQACDADWAPATAGGKMVADCFFVVAPGTWTVEDVSAIDAGGGDLSCCSSEFTGSVTVTESSTTEIGAKINCQTVQSGGLDIYATMNRPPMINNISISPSKFGETCEVQTLGAIATDPEGDSVSYRWQIVSPADDDDFSLFSKGPLAYFSSEKVGDYDVRLTVSDGALSNWLTFPLHITSIGERCNDTDSRVQDAAE